jgi:hypothetical protein
VRLTRGVPLTVQLPTNDGKLFRYVTWPNRVKTNAALRFSCKLPHVRRWHVYLGRISPDLITAVTPVSNLEH